MNYDKIGKFIAKKRKEKGLTQSDLAEKLDITDKAVSKWERGLGCPDVSLLETLSNELDISILEILKGEELKEKMITIDKANDYISEVVNYSSSSIKEKIKKYISNVILITLLFICGILVFLNITHYLYLNHKDYVPIDNITINKINDNLNIIENKLELIKNKQGIYTKEDYDNLIYNLESLYNEYKNMPILSIEEDIYLKKNDLYYLYGDIGPRWYSSDSINYILKKYSNDISKIDNIYNYYHEYNPIGYENFYQERETYKYIIYQGGNTISYSEIRNKLNGAKFRVEELMSLIDLVIEVGEIYE